MNNTPVKNEEPLAQRPLIRSAAHLTPPAAQAPAPVPTQVQALAQQLRTPTPDTIVVPIIKYQWIVIDDTDNHKYVLPCIKRDGLDYFAVRTIEKQILGNFESIKSPEIAAFNNNTGRFDLIIRFSNHLAV
jgi:hypothetical protein